MKLDLLPERHDSAAANMATDFLMLRHYPEDRHARFRHYGWRRAAATFGYSQPVAWVREQLAADPPEEICRRPTGGGVVDHREDWTYALVIPRGHPLQDARAAESYAAVHGALAAVLTDLEVPVRLVDTCAPCPPDRPPGPGVCFAQPERFDLVHADTGAKIAGAAQKRSRHGLLLQGSIARPTVGDIEWNELPVRFGDQLAQLLQLDSCPAAPPAEWDEVLDSLAETYASPEWNERR